MSLAAILRAVWGFARRVPWQAWALLILALTFWWWGHSRYELGIADERASWERTIAEANRRNELEAREKEEAARQHNAEVRRARDAEIAFILADRDSLARRLRDAQANAVRSCPVPEDPGGPGPADPGPEPGGEGGASTADAALDAYDTACRLDAAQLNALIEQIRPQL